MEYVAMSPLLFILVVCYLGHTVSGADKPEVEEKARQDLLLDYLRREVDQPATSSNENFLDGTRPSGLSALLPREATVNISRRPVRGGSYRWRLKVHLNYSLNQLCLGRCHSAEERTTTVGDEDRFTTLLNITVRLCGLTDFLADLAGSFGRQPSSKLLVSGRLKSRHVHARRDSESSPRMAVPITTLNCNSVHVPSRLWRNAFKPSSGNGSWDDPRDLALVLDLRAKNTPGSGRKYARAHDISTTVDDVGVDHAAAEERARQLVVSRDDAGMLRIPLPQNRSVEKRLRLYFQHAVFGSGPAAREHRSSQARGPGRHRRSSIDSTVSVTGSGKQGPNATSTTSTTGSTTSSCSNRSTNASSRGATCQRLPYVISTRHSLQEESGMRIISPLTIDIGQCRGVCDLANDRTPILGNRLRYKHNGEADSQLNCQTSGWTYGTLLYVNRQGQPIKYTLPEFTRTSCACGRR